MIEKRTMGYANFAYPGMEVEPVTVIINTETGKVEIFEVEDEWYPAKETDHFYDTVEQAVNALDDYKRELIGKMEKVKTYLEVMSEWEPDKDENSPFHFDRQDYLTDTLWCYTYDRDNTLSGRECERLFKENKYIREYIRTGFLNIRGNSFMKNDVIHIRWGKEKAELMTRDGGRVTTCNETEFSIVKMIFGNNTSRHTYNRLNDSDE